MGGIVPHKTFSRNQFLFRKKDYLCKTQVSQVRNTAFGARMGVGKSLPRGEGFRVRVMYT